MLFDSYNSKLPEASTMDSTSFLTGPRINNNYNYNYSYSDGTGGGTGGTGPDAYGNHGKPEPFANFGSGLEGLFTTKSTSSSNTNNNAPGPMANRGMRPTQDHRSGDETLKSSDVAPERVAMPPYYSGEPDGVLISWLTWWDDYFSVNGPGSPSSSGSSAHVMTQTAAGYLKGNALIWYRSVMEAYGTHSNVPEWPDFKRAVITMFEQHQQQQQQRQSFYSSSSMHTSPNSLNIPLHSTHPITTSHHRTSSTNSDLDATMPPHQDGSVMEYTSNFRRYWSNSSSLSTENLLAKYIQGLDVDIRYKVAARRPATLDDAINFAMVEDQILFESNFEQRQIGHDVIANLFNGGRGAAPGAPIAPAGAPGAPGVGSRFYAAQQPPTLLQPQQKNNLLEVNLPKLTPEGREQLRKLGGCFRCRQLGHQKDSCPLLALGNNVPPPTANTSSNTGAFAVEGSVPAAPNAAVGGAVPSNPGVAPGGVGEPNLSIPKLTAEERERLRKFGGCYRCRQIGHQKENCPMNLTDTQLGEEQDFDHYNHHDGESVASDGHEARAPNEEFRGY